MECSNFVRVTGKSDKKVKQLIIHSYNKQSLKDFAHRCE